MNVKVISVNVGKALLVSAFFMLLSLLVSYFNGMDSSFGPLFISFILTFVVGVFPLIFVRGEHRVEHRDGFLIIVLSWLLSFLFGMLPYVLWGGEFTLVNAWWESVAGYTTTGSTILRDIEALPDGLLFWRSSTHFIGGLGVVIFLLLILPDSSPFKFRLTNLELSTFSREGYRLRSGKMVKVILSVYIGIFLTTTVALVIAGMPVFDAVNHSFSITATGGFSTKNASIGFYDSHAVNLVVMVMMFISGLHFGWIYSMVVTRSLRPLRNRVARYFLLCTLVLTVILTLTLKFQAGYVSTLTALEHGAFEVLSYITTTGFAITDNSQWPALANTVLMFAALQCACSGSTTGGLKADRLYIAFQAIGRQVHRVLHPSAVTQVRVGTNVLRDETVLPVMNYIVLYFLLIGLSTLLLQPFGVSFMDAFSGSIASLGNVGPAVGEIGAAGNYSFMPSGAKVIYSLDMILGRLEIYPVLVVASMLFRRNR